MAYRWTKNKIVKWHCKTFPDATLETQLLKTEEEMREWRESPKDSGEMADVLICAASLCGRFNSAIGDALIVLIDPKDDIRKLVDLKMEINIKRIWEKSKNGTYRHKGE